jgi:O-antigen/teichoic acid export membrane protein
MARAIYKNVLSAFLREVLLRIFTSISILLIASSLTDYHGFLMIYLASSALIAIVLAYSIYREKHFKIVKIAPQILTEKRSLVYYGIFTVLSGTSVALIQNLDVYMLSIFADIAGVGAKRSAEN